MRARSTPVPSPPTRARQRDALAWRRWTRALPCTGHLRLRADSRTIARASVPPPCALGGARGPQEIGRTMHVAVELVTPVPVVDEDAAQPEALHLQCHVRLEDVDRIVLEEKPR